MEKNEQKEISKEDFLNQKGPIGFLKKEWWIFGSFIFIVTPMMVHTSSLIIEVSGLDFNLFPYDEILYGILFALGFDLAILNYAVHGRVRAANGLAWIVFIFNFVFLNLELVKLIGIYPMNTLLFGGEITLTDGTKEFLEPYGFGRLIITLVLSASSAWIIHSYVKFFVEKDGERKKIWGLFKKIEDQDKKIRALEKTVDEQNKAVEEANQIKNTFAKEREQWKSQIEKLEAASLEKEKINEELHQKLSSIKSEIKHLSDHKADILKAGKALGVKAHINGQHSNESTAVNGNNVEASYDTQSNEAIQTNKIDVLEGGLVPMKGSKPKKIEDLEPEQIVDVSDILFDRDTFLKGVFQVRDDLFLDVVGGYLKDSVAKIHGKRRGAPHKELQYERAVIHNQKGILSQIDLHTFE